jgi:hypothetical protein
VIAAIDRIIPIPEVEAVKTIVARTCKGELGYRMPPIVVVVEGV